MDWLIDALYSYYLTLAMVGAIAFFLGAGTHAMLHRCPEPEISAGFDDYGHMPVVVPELDDRVYRL